MTQSPPIQRKRRSRSPSLMHEDRYRPHHRSSTLTSNVRGTDEGDDSENDDLGQPSSSEEDNKPDTTTNDYSMFPANLLAEEKRASFFKTILNPPHSDNRGGHGGSGTGTGSEKSSGGGNASASGGNGARKRDLTNSPQVSGNGAGCANGANGSEAQPKHVFGVKKPPPTFDDPITVGLITEEEAKTLFELYVLSHFGYFPCRFPTYSTIRPSHRAGAAIPPMRDAPCFSLFRTFP